MQSGAATESVDELGPQRQKRGAGQVEGGDDPVELGLLTESGRDGQHGRGDDCGVEGLEGEGEGQTEDEFEAVGAAVILFRFCCVVLNGLKPSSDMG